MHGELERKKEIKRKIAGAVEKEKVKKCVNDH